MIKELSYWNKLIYCTKIYYNFICSIDFTLMKFFKEQTLNYIISEMTEYVVSQLIESFNWILKLLNYKNLHKLKYFLSIKSIKHCPVSFVLRHRNSWSKNKLKLT